MVIISMIDGLHIVKRVDISIVIRKIAAIAR
jgi:hypothetical protein